MSRDRPGPVSVGCELPQAVAQFLYREARMLDQRRFRDWLQLLADDIHYWAPCCREGGAGMAGEAGHLALFDDDKASLEQRVIRLESGRAWAEQPPSRTQRVISNVEARTDGDGIQAFSAALLYRSRPGGDRDMLLCRREDRLRVRDEGFEIVQRKVILADWVLPAKNLTTFL